MTDERPALADYGWRRTFPTRWHDNDVFGHLNNTIYYAAMDTTVTSWLLDGVAALHGRPVPAAETDPAFVVASSCRYFASAAFPDTLVVGLRADRVGTTSISWGLGIFREADGELLAMGSFVHVFVGRDDLRPIPVPAAIRERIGRELEAGA
ncbi:acyl-CoA thioesterase [Amnibacterium setariae]|uniref:Acyl-CoA thioesterase n=1 Tax=Amnibacterium setariae TaxID=2306585 RepID=A0A3A1U135_9MICO|nr:thioesterase family protein [Amnibacterium setariae]RIX27527.1 acyl-CoA thioesterase [Amnibacterium setariae]